MKTVIISFLSSLLPMLAIDGVFLSVMGRRFYSKYIGHLMAASPQWLPVFMFYLLYALGITYFIVMPAVGRSFSYAKIFLVGAFFGLIAYAAYDLTNQATLKDWPVIVTIVDMLWGAVLTGSVSVIAVYLTKYLSYYR